MTHILHPELFSTIPIVGASAAEKLEREAQRVADATPESAPGITVAIRAWNDAGNLDKLFMDLSKQEYGGDVEFLVADHESIDSTTTSARYHGARVIPIPGRDYTIPGALNRLMDAASHDAVYHLMGGALLSNRQTLAAASNVLDRTKNPVSAGGFARVLPGADASRIERWLGIGNRLFYMRPRETTKATLGVMATQNCVVSKEVWKAVGKFDERYETGGADTALARLALKAGFSVHEEPVLAVHHTYGLGFRDTLTQWRHWVKTVKGPVPVSELGRMRTRPALQRRY